jgi:bacillithiol biosynthesis cysteine-adding enzyme BshC
MPFQKTEIDFSDTPLLSRLVSDYITGNNQVRPFYSAFPDEQGFRALIDSRKNFNVDRKTLVEILSEQNHESNESVKKNIRLLMQPETFTVTTGHQLNLFTGPLYFIYKILSAIKLSDWLNEKFPGKNFVPVYWMASEDNDIAEINHTQLFGKKIEWKNVETGAAGRLSSNGVDAAIEELKIITGNNREAGKLISLISEAYQAGHSLSEATRKLVNALFGKYGLVIIDADNAKLKKLFVPVMKDELLHQVSFEKTKAAISTLEKMNYEIQVNPREINLFYMQEHSRERIVKENNVFKVLNSEKTWNETEIISELGKNPERFSPNVVLRPLYQETILPNIAYVGGPAEIAYWLEYKNMFDHFKCSFPALVLRNCAMIADAGSAKRMQKLKISESDVFKSADQLSKEFIKNDNASFSMDEEMAIINSAFDSLYRKANAIDPTISKSVAAENQKQLNAIKSLEEKIIRAEKKKHEISIQQIQKVKDRFFPDGNLQERHENFIPFWIEHGESFFDDLLASFEPVSKEFHFLQVV